MMFCFYARWQISKAEDTGSVLPQAACRHLDSCPECARFARITRTMGDRLGSAAGSVRVRREMPARDWFGAPAMAYITAGFAVLLCIGIIAAGLKINPAAPSEPANAAAVQEVAVQEQHTVQEDEVFFLEKPMFVELDALAQDADNAVQFIHGYFASLR
jgi:hypothetical protein